MAGPRLVVIGGDAAGMSAASRLKRRRPDFEIEVFEMGRHVSYGACGIPYFVSGEVPRLEDLVVVTREEFEQKRGIKVNLEHRVTGIDLTAKAVKVRTPGGTDLESPYDHLLISTGARPIIPSGFDMSLPGVFAVRGLDEAGRLRDFIETQSPKRAVVAGAGYIGLEMAEALVAHGLTVTMVGSRDRVMPSLEEELSVLAAEALAEKGVELRTGVAVTAVEKGDPLRVKLEDGSELPADLVVAAVGVAPRSELARDAGIELGAKDAIKVDRLQRTSAPGVLAAGDCAEAYHLLLGRNTFIPLALTANRQGRIAGSTLGEEGEKFPGILGSAVTRFFDLTLARTGLGLHEARSMGLEVEKVEVKSGSRAHYMPGHKRVTTLVIAEKGTGRLWGAQMAGRDGVAHRINIFATALANRMALKELSDLDLAYAPGFSPVWDPVLVSSEVALKKVKK